MKQALLWLGVALCLASLWAFARHDVVRLRSPERRVLARVTGHRSIMEDGSRSHAAVYAFADESGEHEVVDLIYRPDRRPPVESMVELRYPHGRPDLARPPRPVLWFAVYGLLLWLAATLAAELADQA